MPDSLHILIVEDDPTNAVVLRLMLAKLGYTPQLCTTGEEAMDRIRETPFDLVFLDIRLSGMSGIDTARRIRQHTTTPPFLVAATAHLIALNDGTALDTASALAYYQGRGMDDVLIKPYQLRDVTALLDRYRSSRA